MSGSVSRPALLALSVLQSCSHPQHPALLLTREGGTSRAGCGTQHPRGDRGRERCARAPCGVASGWGSSLSYHPHLHCVVPGGGLAPSGDRWIACRPRFFLPVRVLSRRFRTLFLDQLEQAFRRGRLRLGGSLADLADPAAFARYLRPLRRREWAMAFA